MTNTEQETIAIKYLESGLMESQIAVANAFEDFYHAKGKEKKDYSNILFLKLKKQYLLWQDQKKKRESTKKTINVAIQFVSKGLKEKQEEVIKAYELMYAAGLVGSNANLQTATNALLAKLKDQHRCFRGFTETVPYSQWFR